MEIMPSSSWSTFLSRLTLSEIVNIIIQYEIHIEQTFTHSCYGTLWT